MSVINQHLVAAAFAEPVTRTPLGLNGTYADTCLKTSRVSAETGTYADTCLKTSRVSAETGTYADPIGPRYRDISVPRIRLTDDAHEAVKAASGRGSLTAARAR